MNRKPAFVLALVLVCAVAAVFLLATGPTSPARQKIQLPDGNIVTLEKVTFSLGTQHDFSFDDSTLARFGRKLPRFLRRYFPTSPRMSWNTSSNSLVLWFTLADGKTGAPLDFHSWLTAEVVDEHGCSSSHQTGGSMKSGSAPPIYVVTLTRFPRRQEMFRVRLRERPTPGALSTAGELNKVVAEFEVPNPTRGPFPVWTPELTPIARTNGDLVFVLKDAGNPMEGPSRKPPQFDIFRDGLPAGDWEYDALNVSDATGNHGSRAFCTDEPAWKLEVEFVRNAKAEFLPSELFTITNLTVPADGVAIQLTNTFALQGKQFALCAIAGSGRFVYSNNVVTLAEPPLAGQDEKSHRSMTYQGATPIHTIDVRRSAPHLALMVPPLAGEERLLLRARGRDGVAHKLVPDHTSGSPWLFLLASVTDAESFDLDVIVQRVRRAEFIVKPPGKR